MTLIEKIYYELMQFEAKVQLPRESMAIIMSYETFMDLHRRYWSLCNTPATRSILTTDWRIFGLPVILSRDIKEPFGFVYMPWATEKGGEE